ncbi:hypothetical protein LPY66_12475 [Dehalobacter sp. DCM]|uniref:hypothetical protein n=1 Tax=Dehalobacter sp. DCM TaxID=2907827 RepID=UPI0030815385|nr:hypothetical protein LPY66_12475 [Dehalobacter sp. DCM]
MEIDNDQIHVLSLGRNSQKKVQINMADILPSIKLPAGFVPDTSGKKQIVDALRDYRLNHWGSRKIRIYLLLPFQNGIIQSIKFPWMAKKYRDKAVIYTIEHEILLPKEQLVYRYVTVKERKNDFLSLSLIGIRKETLSFYMDCFQQAGYDIRGTEYSITALSQTLAHIEKRILFLQRGDKGCLQAVLYSNGQPSTVKEITADDETELNYLMCALIKDRQDNQQFLNAIITDECSQTQKIAKHLMDDGFAKEIHSFPIQGASMALFAGSRRIAKKENINLSFAHVRAKKVRATAFMGSIVGGLIILFSCLTYAEIRAHNENRTEMTVLQDVIQTYQQKEQQAEPLLSEGINTRNNTLADFKHLRTALETIDRDIALTRIIYRRGDVSIWADCSNNTQIMNTMTRLTVNGWSSPQLVEYHCKAGKIDFCLRMTAESYNQE